MESSGRPSRTNRPRMVSPRRVAIEEFHRRAPATARGSQRADPKGFHTHSGRAGGLADSWQCRSLAIRVSGSELLPLAPDGSPRGRRGPASGGFRRRRGTLALAIFRSGEGDPGVCLGEARRRAEHSGTRNSDRKSTRLNSSHITISYAVFCLKKKKKKQLIIFNSTKKQKK